MLGGPTKVRVGAWPQTLNPKFAEAVARGKWRADSPCGVRGGYAGARTTGRKEFRVSGLGLVFTGRGVPTIYHKLLWFLTLPPPLKIGPSFRKQQVSKQ